MLRDISVVVGDITTVDHGIVIHGCNAQGVMNSGVARAIRNKWDGAYKVYLNNVKWRKQNGLGTVHEYRHSPELSIINAITQDRYGRDNIRYVNYEAIAVAFETVAGMLSHPLRKDIPKVIHMPLIGAGLGGGNWEAIQAIIRSVVPESIELKLWVLEE